MSQIRTRSTDFCLWSSKKKSRKYQNRTRKSPQGKDKDDQIIWFQILASAYCFRSLAVKKLIKKRTKDVELLKGRLDGYNDSWRNWIVSAITVCTICNSCISHPIPTFKLDCIHLNGINIINKKINPNQGQLVSWVSLCMWLTTPTHRENPTDWLRTKLYLETKTKIHSRNCLIMQFAYTEINMTVCKTKYYQLQLLIDLWANKLSRFLRNCTRESQNENWSTKLRAKAFSARVSLSSRKNFFYSSSNKNLIIKQIKRPKRH